MSGRGQPAGERVLPPSRRPDGTLRKEVRIRAGYVPQDEQPVYEARGTAPKSSGKLHLPPGLDPSHVAAKQAKSSKYAKKNERKRERKAAAAGGAAEDPEGEEGEEEAGSAAPAASAAVVQKSLETLHVSAPANAIAPTLTSDAAPPGKQTPSKSAPSEAAPSMARPADPCPGSSGGDGARNGSGGAGEEANSKMEIEKKIRALRKKIRQAEMLQESLKAGGSESKPTSEVLEKIGKLPGWNEEVRLLEARQ